MLQVAVVGATGYTGYELLRLLHLHPNVEISHLFSTGQAGESTQDLCQGIPNLPDTFSSFDKTKDYDLDLLFLAVPHATTHEYMHELATKSYKVIDLSADFRLNDAALFEEHYGLTHQNADLLDSIPYGIPELYADSIKHAKIVANPGCYSTTAILGLYPLAKAGVIEHVIIDAKSGVSGAGKAVKKESMYCEVNEHFSSYATNAHRHQAELREHLGVEHVFSPHLVPMSRGILCSSYVQSNTAYTEAELFDLYQEYYEDCPFITVQVAAKASTQTVVGSNRVEITLSVANGQLTVFSASDNLIKGAAGQAIQNMNIMYGLDERAGLPLLAQTV